MANLNELYDYPVVVTSEDFSNFTGYDLSKDIEEGRTRGDRVINDFLSAVHSIIYDSVIYNCGDRDIKNRIIEKYRLELEKPIKRALLAQGVYIIENGDPSTWSGITLNAGGAADVKDSNVLKQKAVCPRALSILMGTQPKITYAGEGE